MISIHLAHPMPLPNFLFSSLLSSASIFFFILFKMYDSRHHAEHPTHDVNLIGSSISQKQAKPLRHLFLSFFFLLWINLELFHAANYLTRFSRRRQRCRFASKSSSCYHPRDKFIWMNKERFRISMRRSRISITHHELLRLREFFSFHRWQSASLLGRRFSTLCHERRKKTVFLAKHFRVNRDANFGFHF